MAEWTAILMSQFWTQGYPTWMGVCLAMVVSVQYPYHQLDRTAMPAHRVKQKVAVQLRVNAAIHITAKKGVASSKAVRSEAKSAITTLSAVTQAASGEGVATTVPTWAIVVKRFWIAAIQCLVSKTLAEKVVESMARVAIRAIAAVR
jgi:hypothetical protein